MKTFEAVETALNVAGVGVGITMIKDVLGVVLLVLNLGLLLVRGIIWFIRWYRKAMKDGKTDPEELEELAAGISEAQKYIEEKQDVLEENENNE